MKWETVYQWTKPRRYLLFCLLGPTMHGTHCWCSTATRSSYSEVFQIAWREELCDYLQDSRNYWVVGRLTASNYKVLLEELPFFSLQFESFSVCVFLYGSGRLYIRFWCVQCVNTLQNTHSHKAISVSWYTNVTYVKGIYPVAHTSEVKYCALWDIQLKWKLAAYWESAHVTKTTKTERKEKTKIEIR